MYHQQSARPPYSSSSSNFSHGTYNYGMNSYESQANNQVNLTSSNGSVPGQNESLISRMDERSAFSLLSHLGKDELNHLMENDDKLQDLINDLSQVKSIQEEHDNLVVSNKSIAEYNLSLQPRLEDLKHTVASGYEQQNSLKNSLAEDKAELDTFVNRQSLDTLLALLQTETAKVEEESETLTTEFYDRALDLEEFESQFLSKRTTMHLRRSQSERMAELIREGPLGMTSSSSTSAAPYPVPGGSAPYPTGQSFSMPQPRLPYQ